MDLLPVSMFHLISVVYSLCDSEYPIVLDIKLLRIHVRFYKSHPNVDTNHNAKISGFFLCVSLNIHHKQKIVWTNVDVFVIHSFLYDQFFVKCKDYVGPT
jgi:hypothetical protein